MEKFPISIVVMTKNNDDQIKDCLDSAKWADDIVVVDDMSADRTLDIARRYTDTIFKRKWDMEGAQRNFAYSKAKHTYILSLDADERVTPELRDEIMQVLKDGPKYNGYNIPHKNYIGQYWMRYGGWYNRKMKLFRKDLFRYEESEYHPRAIMEGPRGDLKGEIVHYAYADFKEFLSKLNHQTSFEARKWFRENRRIGLAKCLRKCWTRFVKSFFIKKGFKDGFIGFMLACFDALYQLISYAKYWELKRQK